jgi:hypothetical protein
MIRQAHHERKNTLIFNTGSVRPERASGAAVEG